MTEAPAPTVLTLHEAAARARVSIKTLGREIAAGKLSVLRIRGCTRILAADLDAYLTSARRCLSAATAPNSRPECSSLGVGLAALLGLDGTLRSGRGATARRSTIIALDARRPTASKKPSSAG